jgi:DNA-binding LacI/PurR family transcriptional regulator
MEKQKLKKSFVPIYQALFDRYQQAILTQEYHPGDRIDSINEIHQRFTVSRETAKLVLKKLADAGLIVQKPGKGSFISDLGPRQPVWGVIVPFFSSQVEELLYFLQVEASKQERRIEYFVDYNNWQEEIRLVGTLIHNRYEAVIIIPVFDESKTMPFYQKLSTGGTTLSLMNHTMTSSSFSYVIQSFDLGVQRAIQYLQAHTHGTIAFVKNNLWQGRNMIQEVMEATFDGFMKKDEPWRRSVVIDNINSLTRSFMIENHITGFFCCDDSDAVRIVGRLNQWQFRFPQEIRLVSYGNTELARFFTPAITSIDPFYQQMAGLTADIINRDQQKKEPRLAQHVLQPELIVRET